MKFTEQGLRANLITEQFTMLKRLFEYITNDIWKIHTHELSGAKIRTIRQVKIILLSVRGFRADNCYLRASALTYYTMLAIVPILALAFGISKGFGLEENLQIMLYKNFDGQKEVIDKIVLFSNNLLDDTKGGVIAGVGIVILLWAVIKLLGHIEKAFNDIWGIKQNRNYIRKFTDYLSIVLVCPILLIVSGSLTVIVTTKLAAVVHGSSSFQLTLSSATQYIIIWLLFSFIYLFMPNCKVKIKYALVAGIIAGTVFILMEFIYIRFQIGVVRYNAIYGSFAAIPLFLLFIQIGWVIVLTGAEISFALQHIEEFEYDYTISNLSNKTKKILFLRITALIVKDFCKGSPAQTSVDISQRLKLPMKLTGELLYELVQAKVLAEVKNPDDLRSTYLPTCGTEKITLYHVIKSLNISEKKNLQIVRTKEIDTLDNSISEFNRLIENSPSNILLKDL